MEMDRKNLSSKIESEKHVSSVDKDSVNNDSDRNIVISLRSTQQLLNSLTRTL